MNKLTARNLPDDVLRTLQRRALRNGWSVDSEVCELLSKAVKPEKRVRMGDALAALGRATGLTNEDVARMDEAIKRR